MGSPFTHGRSSRSIGVTDKWDSTWISNMQLVICSCMQTALQASLAAYVNLQWKVYSKYMLSASNILRSILWCFYWVWSGLIDNLDLISKYIIKNILGTNKILFSVLQHIFANALFIAYIYFRCHTIIYFIKCGSLKDVSFTIYEIT